MKTKMILLGVCCLMILSIEFGVCCATQIIYPYGSNEHSSLAILTDVSAFDYSATFYVPYEISHVYYYTQPGGGMDGPYIYRETLNGRGARLSYTIAVPWANIPIVNVLVAAPRVSFKDCSVSIASGDKKLKIYCAVNVTRTTVGMITTYSTNESSWNYDPFQNLH